MHEKSCLTLWPFLLFKNVVGLKNMTKKMNLKWRLGKLPSVEELRELVKDKIITQEEAKQVLFSTETEESKDIKSLEAEIKFLKEIIESLSRGVSYREVIREMPIYYRKYDWYTPTVTYLCGVNTDAGTSGTFTTGDENTGLTGTLT